MKEILEFVKIEHTLFSLPFVFMGAWIAGEPTIILLVWILVAAVGRPNFVKSEWVKKGAVVIDVGINRLPPEGGKKGRLVGDVDFNSVSNVASAITPVPGGVGPMTIACLLRNTVTAACKRRN